MTLQDFMAAHVARPWQHGVTDCAFVLADWIVAQGRPDPAAEYRARYTTAEGWQAFLTARGGLLPVASDIFARAGLVPVSAPSPGVVAVIGSLRVPARQLGAIQAVHPEHGKVWQVRVKDGFQPFKARALGMWSVDGA